MGFQQFMFRSILAVTFVAIASIANAGEPRTLEYKESLAAYTSGASSIPTDAQVARFCECIWSKLP